jgi:hypothetical protein
MVDIEKGASLSQNCKAHRLIERGNACMSIPCSPQLVPMAKSFCLVYNLLNQSCISTAGGCNGHSTFVFPQHPAQTLQ